MQHKTLLTVNHMNECVTTAHIVPIAVFTMHLASPGRSSAEWKPNVKRVETLPIFSAAQRYYGLG